MSGVIECVRENVCMSERLFHLVSTFSVARKSFRVTFVHPTQAWPKVKISLCDGPNLLDDYFCDNE